MEEVGIARLRLVDSVKAHDVVILVFDPYAAVESDVARALPRGDIKNKATHIPQELTVGELELVDLAIEVVNIGEDHPGKTKGVVPDGVEPGESAQQNPLETALSGEIITTVDGFA